MDQQFREPLDWISSHKQQTIMIVKEEQGDLDRVLMQLSGVEYRNNKNIDRENYVDEQAIVLHGQGSQLTDHGPVPLPGSTYEIALQGKCHAERDTSNLHIHTERATYSIKANLSPSESVH